jgi:glycosyltransferase involved in cell wall biosynthesis
LSVIAWMIAVLWIWKAVTSAVGLWRVPNLLQKARDAVPAGEPMLVVVVPARDEATQVEVCLRSLLAQDYGALQVVAVDDRSSDGTSALLEALAAEQERLSVLHVTELPEGWLGKTHAMAMAARHAIAIYRPEYLLFSDADVLFAPDALRRGLAEAVETGADHFVLAPTPILQTTGEAVMLGFLQMMGLWAARPWKVADPKAKRDAIGIGAFNLLRTEAYLALGGFDALRMQILEDLTLARKVKQMGMRQRVAFGPGMVRLHWAAGAMGIVRVMTKNLFAIFGFRPLRLLGACLALSLLCLGPFVGLVIAGARVPSVLALGSIVALYWVARSMGRIPAWTAVGFPFSVCLFQFSLLRSMVVTLRDGGVIWRGTFYSLAELRRNVQLL